MTFRFETTSKGCLLVAACVVLTASGCGIDPELRIAGEAERSATIAEGISYLEQGRAVDAVAAFRKHLRVEGTDLQSLNGLAIAYGELGREDLAGEMFSRALALSPDDPATLNNIGFAALRRADARLARRYLEKARDRSEGSREIEGNLERLALLEAFERDPRKRRPLLPARLDSAERVATPIRRLVVAGGDARPSPKETPPRSPPTTMIDFTAVVDPFARSHEKK